MRALMTSTVPSMIGKFNMKNIELLQELGYEVDVACDFTDTSVWDEKTIKSYKIELNEKNINFFQVDFSRSSLKFERHGKSYKQMLSLLNEREYGLIHTHTPISSFITRLAFKNSCIYDTCRLIYTAHGFHFYKGNNIFTNYIFRNMEKYAARFTDVLITINKEDYKAAKKFVLKREGDIEYVPGIGIDIAHIDSIKGNRNGLLENLKISGTSFLLISVGELNSNKNHSIVIKALPSLPSSIHYLICGIGSLESELMNMAKLLNVEDRLHLLGYKNNIIEIMKSCDCFVFPSKREGLSVALMEAMACGLPCIASNIRGNSDLLESSKGGQIFGLKNFDKELINLLKDKNQLNFNTLDTNYKIQIFSKECIEDKMRKIYSSVRDKQVTL